MFKNFWVLILVNCPLMPPPLQFLSVSAFLIGNTMWSPNTISDWSIWVNDAPWPNLLTNLHATQPHTERIQAVTWTWISEPNLVAVFPSSVPWSSSSSSRCRRRLILSSVKHYKGTKKKLQVLVTMKRKLYIIIHLDNSRQKSWQKW